MSRVALVVKPTPTESQRRKTVLYEVVKLLRLLSSWLRRAIKLQHKMRALPLFYHVPFSSGSEGLNCVHFPLLHFRCLRRFDDRNSFSGMDLVRTYRVPVQIHAGKTVPIIK